MEHLPNLHDLYTFLGALIGGWLYMRQSHKELRAVDAKQEAHIESNDIRLDKNDSRLDAIERRCGANHPGAMPLNGMLMK